MGERKAPNPAPPVSAKPAPPVAPGRYRRRVDGNDVRALCARIDSLIAMLAPVLERLTTGTVRGEWVDGNLELREYIPPVISAPPSSLHLRLLGLASKWIGEQTEYPHHDAGRHAAAAVRCCARELVAAIEADSGDGDRCSSSEEVG